MKDVYPYTPRKTKHERLDRYFVARHDLLDELMRSLRQQAKAKSLQHWMILGPRGLGKSHLVALLYHRIKETPKLHAKWIPLLMDEEEPEVFSLPTLFARIVEVLGEELQKETPEKAIEVMNFLDGLRREARSPEHLCEDLVAYLKDFTNQNRKRIVVFLENTDDLLTCSLKSNLEIKTLRHLLLNENFVLFITTSPTFFERIEKQKEPLYGLFRLRHLELLDFDQSMDLMCRWAEAAENGEMLARLRRPDFRLRVLYHLTGGNPRLLLFLYLTLSNQKEMESATEAFGKLLEHDLTGFYLSRMRDIPEQEKPIVIALSKSRTNLTQKEIAERTFLPVGSMGTHINRLERSDLVRALTKKAGKNTLYGLTDHLFRLWHQWRTGWREREIIQALVEFLAIWYRKQDLISLADGKGMHALYARQAVELRHAEEFKSRLELVREEAMSDLTRGLEQRDQQGIFHLIESLSDFDLDLDPVIEELEKSLFNRGSESSYLEVLERLENQLIEKAGDSDEEDRKKPVLDRIKLLKALAEIAKGQAFARIPVQEIENKELAILIGKFKLKEKDLSGAEEAFQRAVDLEPNDAVYWNNLGAARYYQENYVGAEEACHRVLDLEPNDALHWSNLGRACYNQENYVGAEEAFQCAVDLAPDDAGYWNNLGRARYNQENYAGAEEAYQRAVDLAPNDAVYWNNLGVYCYFQENYAGAEEAYQHAVDLEPKDAIYWNRLGLVRYYQENYAGAEDAYQHAVDLAPGDAGYWNNLGTARYIQENYAGAEEAVQRAVDVEPNEAAYCSNLGVARYYQENYAGAEDAFRRTVTIDKERAAEWYYIGVTCYCQGKFKESHKAFLETIEIIPEYIEAYADLVELHVVSQSRFDALKQIDRSLKLKRIESHVRAALYLFRAISLTADENKPAAIQALKNGQKWIDKLEPDTPAEQRQSVLAELMNLLKDLILPNTWHVVDSYLGMMAESAPNVHEIIGRLEYVVQYYKELEFEPGEKAVRRDKAADNAQRILDRLPSEERGPIEEMVKEVEVNINRWRKIKKTAKTKTKKRAAK